MIANLTNNAQTVLCKRYFLPKPTGKECDHCGKRHETIDELWERVSFGYAPFFDLMSNLYFLPNSPTLFNGGTGQGTLSACFKFDVEDSMLGVDSIMDISRKAAAVQKWGGGVGYTLSKLRPKGSKISTTHGVACGPIEVLRFYHAVAMMITQGGKRDGAQMGILSCDHPDIKEFIHCKDEDPNALLTFNISVALTDDFMTKALENETSEEGLLLQEMAESAWRTGDPGCYFIDIAERSNPTPWIGELTGTNPCGEVPLLNNEPCNLGSISIPTVVSDGSIDFHMLESIAYTATEFLDIILDNNTFPDPDIEKVAKLTRKLGMGVMGWADALMMLKVPYDSNEAIDLGDEVMKTINDSGHKASMDMVKEKGVFPAVWRHPEVEPHTDEAGMREGYAEKKVEALKLNRRNATVTCIAPTGTIAIIAGVSSGIEPHFSLENSRTMGDGTVMEERVDVLSEFVPKTSHEIEMGWHLKHQAAFQRHTDLAVSKTINLPNSATVEEIHNVYRQAWNLGCKGVTVYRDGARVTQVLETYKYKEDKEILDGDSHFHGRKRLPKTRTGKVHSFRVDGVEGYVQTGEHPDGTLGEIFTTMSHMGSTVDGLMDTISILASLCLQYGVPLESLVSKMRHRRFEPAGLTDDREIPHATSLTDYIFHFLELTYLDRHEEVPAVGTGMFCDECSAPALNLEGCLICSKECGWSRC